MASVSCPSCGAHLTKGVLRCRFCGADARAATSVFLAAHTSLVAVVCDVPREAAPRSRRRDPDELVAASRELFFGP